MLSNHRITIRAFVQVFSTVQYFVLRKDRARVVESENDRNKYHQEGIQDVHVDFLPDQTTVVALCIFDHPKDGPNQNEHASEIKNLDERLPARLCSLGLGRWAPRNSNVKDRSHDHKGAEKDDLYAETEKNNFVAEVLTGLILRTCEDPTT